MDRPPTRLVRRSLSLKHLDHQSLASFFDGLVEEGLDVLDVAGVLGGGEGELLLDGLEMLTKELTTGFEVLVEEGLLYEIEGARRGERGQPSVASFCLPAESHKPSTNSPSHSGTTNRKQTDEL